MTRIFIYGTGNMAWALVQGFQKIHIEIAGVFGHSYENAQLFCQDLQIPALSNPTKETRPGDIVLLAIKDDALPLINQNLQLPGRIVLHTAGSINMNVIHDISDKIGVFYPLQRMQKYKENNFEDVPICVESNDVDILNQISDLADKLSGKAIKMSSEQRLKAHLAAVFVSNFSNFMLVMGHELLKSNNLPSDLLDALLRDLFQEIDLTHAADRQTGPARRGDLKVIQSHLKMLENSPSQENIYRLLSFEILKYFNREE